MVVAYPLYCLRAVPDFFKVGRFIRKNDGPAKRVVCCCRPLYRRDDTSLYAFWDASFFELCPSYKRSAYTPRGMPFYCRVGRLVQQRLYSAAAWEVFISIPSK